MPTPAPRPTQVTVAAGMVVAGSVVVVLTAFDQVAGLHSLETRKAVEEFLGEGFGKSLGLGVQDMLSLMRVLTMITAACATAAAILGVQVLRRSRSARLVLTVLAAPLFLAGVVVGGLVPSIIVGSIAMMWFQPARDWIDGKTPRVVTPPPAPVSRPARPPQPPPVAPPPTAPRAYPGFGDAAPTLGPTPPPAAAPYAAVPVLPPHPGGPPRPAALVWACALAWAGCGLTFLAMAASVALTLAAPDTLIGELYRQNPDLADDGITEATLRSTVLFAGTILMLWSVVASVIAAFAFRGRSWAWTALLVSASSAAVLCLLASLGNPVMLLALVLCAAAVPLLLRPEVRDFVRYRSASRQR